MDIKDMLLYYSFSQIKGVSGKKERSYWDSGDTLRSVADRLQIQESLFDEESDRSGEDVLCSINALRARDAAFFLNRLNHREYYRAAYSFPQKVMFLDIETTGLSTVYHYVTCIGWIVDGRYDCWIQGTDPERFFKAFREAELVVTYNGTLFDCKFLDHAFHTDMFSRKPQLDLRFLCARFGLTGGQKEIERSIRFSRPEALKETNGKEAVALWYSFLFGRRAALKHLIEYNFYDVLGMTYILDHIFYEEIYGKVFPKRGNPSVFYNEKIRLWKKECMPPKADCDQIRIYVKENISNFSKDLLKDANRYRIVGIDLAGKTSSRTGLCLLRGSAARTEVAHTDEEIMSFIDQAKPDLVSIDAPLSLPKGRTSVYDDDPERAAGILREAERELKRRNVNSYPALIPSMQELTRRGIDLAGRLRQRGYPVIECFPGAAQDVVQLPRKRTDESLLKRGLSNFGIKGAYRSTPVCHDELDAITASLVGQFFISGYYEPLGIPEENDMIIPQKTFRPPSHRLVIGLAGPVGTGKTEAGEYLQSRGCHYIRYSQIIARERKRQGKAADRDALREAGSVLYASDSQYELNKLLAAAVEPYQMVVIDGMRHNEDYTFWKEACFSQFILIYIDSKYALRKKRFAARGNESIDYDKALYHPAEADVGALRAKADYIIRNNGTREDLHTDIERILFGLDLF